MVLSIQRRHLSYGQWLKEIVFSLPIIGSEKLYMSLDNGNSVEVVSLLQRVSNTRGRTIKLDVEMEDYHRIKNKTDATADATE